MLGAACMDVATPPLKALRPPTSPTNKLNHDEVPSGDLYLTVHLTDVILVPISTKKCRRSSYGESWIFQSLRKPGVFS